MPVVYQFSNPIPINMAILSIYNVVNVVSRKLPIRPSARKCIYPSTAFYPISMQNVVSYVAKPLLNIPPNPLASSKLELAT